jgi:hypothetical protein
VCEHCGALVKGRGYTDHCPNCLYSKHVDVNPGDRASSCGGLMRPVGVYHNRKSFIIAYECEKCHAKKNVIAASGDNEELLFELAGHTTSTVLSGIKKKRNSNSTIK